MRSVIGLENRRHLLHQADVKLKQIAIHWNSRALFTSLVFVMSSHSHLKKSPLFLLALVITMNLIECFGFFHRLDSLGHSRPKNSHIGVRYMAAVVSPFVHSFTRKSSSRLQFTNFWVNITV